MQAARASGRAAAHNAKFISRRSQRKQTAYRDSHICRVTNLGEEKGQIDERIKVGGGMMRNGRPVGESVEADLIDSIREDDINLADMEYWFHEHPGDFEELKFLEAATEVETKEFSLKNEDWHCKPLSSLQEGQLLKAEIIMQHLLHGAVLDLGVEYHGLIPIGEYQWPQVLDRLNLCDIIEVRVHKIRDPKFYRFPVQLVATDPLVSGALPKPESWRAPIYVGKDSDPMELWETTQPEYIPATFHDPKTMGPDDLEEIAFNELHGQSAPKPELDPSDPENDLPDGSEIPIQYDAWRSANVVGSELLKHSQDSSSS